MIENLAPDQRWIKFARPLTTLSREGFRRKGRLEGWEHKSSANETIFPCRQEGRCKPADLMLTMLQVSTTTSAFDWTETNRMKEKVITSIIPDQKTSAK